MPMLTALILIPLCAGCIMLLWGRAVICRVGLPLTALAHTAVATMAAVAFAGLLVVIMRSDEVRGILTDLVRRALTVA